MQFKFTDASQSDDGNWVFAFIPSLNIGHTDGVNWVELYRLTFHLEITSE